MANDLNRSIKIFIDGSAATNSIGKIEESVNKLELKLASLNTSEEDYEQKSKKLQDEINRKNKTLNDYKTKLAETDRVLKNLSGATYNELIAVQKVVRDQLRQAVPGTQQYTAALEQNRRVTEALTRSQAAMRVEVGCQGTAWGRAANFFNKYMGLFTGAIATITGISMTMRKSVQDFAQISEAMAGVKKYTGMADEEIKALNEDFKKMDTRTSRERLNELAQDAGRLGIQGRKDILDFVDAANIINVALGEDLGEDAVKNIGKLATMFGEDKKLGLRGAMLATASAINEVAQNSSASEPYLVAFTARVAGTAKQAGISQTALIGYASALDQDMQQLEMSGTALQQVMMKMYQQPKVFAKIAGKDVKEFTSLVKNDANEAILQLLESIRKMGGLSETAPIFKEMKLDGVRAAGVLNTLAGSVDKVRAEQKRANDAYREGTSAINEYNVQNNTVQAGLEKAKKKFQEIVYEMGERLAPSMSKIISASSATVRGLMILINFLTEYKGMIAGAASALALWTIAKKADLIVTKLLEAWNNKLTFSFKGLKKEMGSNIFSLLLVAAGAYLGKLYQAKNAQEELKNSVSGMKKVNQETSRSFADQEGKIRTLNAMINDNGIALSERRKALDKLKSIIPEYNAQLSDEGTLTENNTEAIKNYLVQLEKQIRLKAAIEELEVLEKKKRELTKTENEQSDEYWKVRQSNTLQGYNRNSFSAKVSRYFGTEKEDNALNRLNETKTALQEVEQHISDINNEIRQTSVEIENTAKELNGGDDPNSGSGGGGGGNGDEDKADKVRKKKLQDEKENYARLQAQKKEEYLAGNSELLKTEKQFNKAMEQLQLDHLRRSIDIAGEKSSEAADFQNQIADILLKQKKESIQEQLDEEKALYERQQETLKEVYVSGQDENLKTEAAYNDAMEQLTIRHLQQTLEIAGLNADERKRIEKQLLDFKIKCMRDEEKARKKLEDTDQKRKDDLAKKEKQRLTKQAEQYKQYGEQIGDTLGQLIIKQEDALRSFADTMIDILFDVLSQLIEIEIAKATGVAVGAVARASAESFAQADSVATFGATGAARAAILSGLIMGALAAAKSALKGLIKRGGSSGSSSDESDAPKTASVKVSQWASGNYDVIGQDDGKLYRNTPFLGAAPTGIVQRTSLVSENGAELIVNAEDLRRLQRHINYPLVLQAINDARSNRVPQRSAGNYEHLDHEQLNELIKQQFLSSNFFQWPHYMLPADHLAIGTLGKEIQALRAQKYTTIKTYVTLRDLQDAQELDRKSKDAFTRKKS